MNAVGRGGARLTAFRPDSGRIERLHRLCEHAAEAAGPAWRDSLVQLDDAKGDLTAVWRDEAARQAFSHLIDEAWTAEGETEPPFHELHPSPQPHGAP